MVLTPRILTSVVLTSVVLTSVALCLALLLNVARFACNAWLSILYPGEIDYAEGVVWQQARLITDPLAYGDIQQYPFLVFNYPPIYHLIINTLEFLGASWLVAGRTVSILALVAIAVLSGLFVKEASWVRSDRARETLDPTRHAPLIAGLVTALLIFSLDPLRLWARVARVDMLASAFEVLGMYLTLRALRGAGGLYAAGFVFVAAFYTKQTALSAGLAAAITIFLHDWRAALRPIFAAVCLGGAMFVILTILTGGGFAHHIILYNLNEFSWPYALGQFLGLSRQNIQPAYAILAMVALCCLTVRGVTIGVRELPAGGLMVAIYFVLATASLVCLGNLGSSSNYFVPAVCAGAMLVGLAVAEGVRWIEVSRGHAMGLVVLIVVLTAQTLVVPPVGEQRLIDRTLHRESEDLIAMMRATARPVFSENLVLLMQADKQAHWELSNITDLINQGKFDEQKLIALIDARTFAFVVENDTRNNLLINTR